MFSLLLSGEEVDYHFVFDFYFLGWKEVWLLIEQLYWQKFVLRYGRNKVFGSLWNLIFTCNHTVLRKHGVFLHSSLLLHHLTFSESLPLYQFGLDFYQIWTELEKLFQFWGFFLGGVGGRGVNCRGMRKESNAVLIVLLEFWFLTLITRCSFTSVVASFSTFLMSKVVLSV